MRYGCCYDVAPDPYGPPGLRTGSLGMAYAPLGLLLNVPGYPPPAPGVAPWQQNFGAVDPNAVLSLLNAGVDATAGLIQSRRQRMDAAAQAAAAQAEAQRAALVQQQYVVPAPSSGVPGWAIAVGIVAVAGGVALVIARKGRR